MFAEDAPQADISAEPGTIILKFYRGIPGGDRPLAPYSAPSEAVVNDERNKKAAFSHTVG